MLNKYYLSKEEKDLIIENALVFDSDEITLKNYFKKLEDLHKKAEIISSIIGQIIKIKNK